MRGAGGAAGHELVQRDDGEPDGTLVWFEHVITRGMERIRAHLELRRAARPRQQRLVEADKGVSEKAR